MTKELLHHPSLSVHIPCPSPTRSHKRAFFYSDGGKVTSSLWFPWRTALVETVLMATSLEPTLTGREGEKPGPSPRSPSPHPTALPAPPVTVGPALHGPLTTTLWVAWRCSAVNILKQGSDFSMCILFYGVPPFFFPFSIFIFILFYFERARAPWSVWGRGGGRAEGERGS